MQAVHVTRNGGPEVLELVEAPDPTPGPTDLLVRVAAAGLNYIDTYHRGGLYPIDTPFVPGMEGAGTVESVGAGVTRFRPGDRVAWADVLGSDAELAVVPERRAVAVPDDLGLDSAAAAILQGITAHYLAIDTYPLGAGDRCLIHAAAGGVGQLLVQMAKRQGAEVFATAGGPEKVELARRAGADHVIDYRAEDFKDAVERLAGPKPLVVVYDGVGAATFDRGLELLRPRGLMVAFGNASGPPPPLNILRLSQLGALYVTRPTMGFYIATTEELERRTGDLFAWMSAGVLTVNVGARYALADTADAHRALEGRRTTGKVLLIP
ncbi:MAG: quinone oxidoreductase family protein [Acidimicrobiales bacterium]